MRGFFEELRHRNVFRVAIAYAIVGWLLAQVADLVVDAFNLPDRFLQMLILLLVLGFPLAVIFAWAFELTPDGLKRAREVPVDAPKDPRSGKFLNRLTIVTLIMAVAWLGWDKLQRSDGGPTTDTLTADKSIAVLPFADFSPDADATSRPARRITVFVIPVSRRGTGHPRGRRGTGCGAYPRGLGAACR